MAETEIFVQIGITAMRAPGGGFLPAVPLYAKVPAADVNPDTGLYEGEEKALRNVGDVFADKMRQYIENGGIIAPPRRGRQGGKTNG